MRAGGQEGERKVRERCAVKLPTVEKPLQPVEANEDVGIREANEDAEANAHGL